MAIGWITVLQSVPWGEVVRNAPKVAAGAKKLWNTIGAGHGDQPAAGEETQPARPVEMWSAPELQQRLMTLQAASAELEQRLLESSALIKALAEQNTQLIAGIEVLRKRTAWLTAGLLLLVLGSGLGFWLT